MAGAEKLLHSRLLRLKVGDLISAGPGTSRATSLELPALRVDRELRLEYLRGAFRLSRAREGLLLQGTLRTGLHGECSRCLEPVRAELQLPLEELYGHPPGAGHEFGIGEDGILDLAPLLRAETLIAIAGGMHCRPDCRGLCPECGANRNHQACACVVSATDPRLAGLRQLLD